MVVLNKIYTKTGDDGTTALGTGERVMKDGQRVTAYGTIDEANAAIGVARLAIGASCEPVTTALLRIQNDLFDLGADLCVPDRGEELAFTPLRVSAAQVGWLEDQIDALNSELSPLRSFVLPGGTTGGAHLHVARTVCRRAERETITLAKLDGEAVSDAVLQYLNRLSDFLFVASRYVNDKGAADQLWVPGENR